MVCDRTAKTDWDGPDIDWINLLSVSERMIRMIGERDKDIVLSASCGIDQLSIHGTWVAHQLQQIQQLALPTDVIGEREQYLIRSGGILQALLNIAEYEVTEYWDFVYAILPVTVGISITPDSTLGKYNEFLSVVPAFRKVIRLPDNEVSAIDVLDGEYNKWIQKLNSSS